MEQCLILHTRFLIVYAVERYFRLWKLSVFHPLVEQWDYYFSSATGWHGVCTVGWTQLSSLLPCIDVSFVIDIGQGYWLDDEGSPLVCHQYWSGLLARWQRSIFGMLSDRWWRVDTSKSLLYQSCGWTAGGPNKLRGTTKPDGDHVWNGSGVIEGSIVYLELQIGDWLGSLDL